MDPRGKSIVLGLVKNNKENEDVFGPDEEENMKDAFMSTHSFNIYLGFKQKYKVNSIEDVMKALSKIKDKNIEDKFSKFVSYFKTNNKNKKNFVLNKV